MCVSLSVYANFVGVSSNYKLNVVHGISILALKSAKVNYNQRPVTPPPSLHHSLSSSLSFY